MLWIRRLTLHSLTIRSDSFQIPQHRTSAFHGSFMYVASNLYRNKVCENVSELRFKSGLYKILLSKMTLLLFAWIYNSCRLKFSSCVYGHIIFKQNKRSYHYYKLALNTINVTHFNIIFVESKHSTRSSYIGL